MLHTHQEQGPGNVHCSSRRHVCKGQADSINAAGVTSIMNEACACCLQYAQPACMVLTAFASLRRSFQLLDDVVERAAEDDAVAKERVPGLMQYTQANLTGFENTILMLLGFEPNMAK